MTKNNDEPYLPLSAHFEALRRALLLSFALFFAFFAVAYSVAPELLETVLELVKREGEPWTMVALHPLSPLFTEIRVAFWLALFIGFPFILLPISQFLWPALKLKEKKIFLLFMGQALFSVGVALTIALKITFPWAIHFAKEFGRQYRAPFLGLEETTSFFEAIALLHIVLIELFIFFLLLIGFRIIDEPTLRARRKEVIIASFVLGAIVTPPDIVSQCAVAIPLIFTFEALLIFGKIVTFFGRREQDRGALLDRAIYATQSPEKQTRSTSNEPESPLQ